MAFDTPKLTEIPVWLARRGQTRTCPEGANSSCWCPGCRTMVVQQFTASWVTLISDFGAPPSVQRGCENSIRDFVLADDELTYWKRAKNIVCFFKAQYLKNACPDVTGYVFGGAWKRWAKSRMAFNRRNTSLWASTFKLKNAAARLSERAAVATMHQHSKSVSRTFQGDDRLVEESVRTIMPLLEKAAKSIADDFYSGKWESPVAASNSACFESARSDFGQIGHFMRRVFGEQSPLVCPGVGFCGFGPQISAGSRPVSVPRDHQDTWGSTETSAYDFDAYLARLDYVEREESPSVKSIRFYEEVTVDGVRYNNSWFETYYFPSSEHFWTNEIQIDALLACTRDEALAKVAAVLEPFKVRIITKGEAALQYVSTAFQQSAFAFNRTVPCFRLVGVAPSTQHLIDLRKNAEGVVDDPQWASSDFSGASDGTAGRLRDCLMECLTMHLPLHVRSLLNSCNGDHVVSYPGPLLYPSMRELGEIDPVLQTLGTLMGEKTSFIILCYEVLVAHVSNRRRCGDKRPLERILEGVLINGDDRLAISNRETEDEFWSFCERVFGFKESVGKSYLHPSYANINSQSYLFDLRTVSTPWKVPVRCSGLENGQKKLDEPFDPTCVITQILDGCFDSKMEWLVLQRFFKRFKERINSVAAGRNLFVHQSLGGLGNRLPQKHPHKPCRDKCYHRFGCEWKVEVTCDQQFVAGALLNEPGSVLEGMGPALPLEDELPQVLETPWDVYGKATYWNQEEFELKEMSHYYRTVIDKFQGKSPEWVARLPKKSDLLTGRRRTRKSAAKEVDRRVVTQRCYWICPVCDERNLECKETCVVCQIPFTRTHETAMGNLVRTQFRMIDEEQVVRQSILNPRVNFGLGHCRVKRLGYALPELDEFDVALYDHAIESARFELVGQPVVRFKGRAVDLFGDNPLWAPLRPATLVW